MALGSVLPHVRAEPFLPTADQLDILTSAPGGPLGNGLDSLHASFPSECVQLAQLSPVSPGPGEQSGNRQLTEVQMDTITAGVTDVCLESRSEGSPPPAGPSPPPPPGLPPGPPPPLLPGSRLPGPSPLLPGSRLTGPPPLLPGSRLPGPSLPGP
jgi:hypothetical protein